MQIDQHTGDCMFSAATLQVIMLIFRSQEMVTDDVLFIAYSNINVAHSHLPSRSDDAVRTLKMKSNDHLHGSVTIEFF